MDCAFLGKVLERVVSIQLRSYLESNNLFPANQSAYRHHHSTETALLKVANDLLLAIDRGLEACLVLLDFSSAFDCLNHAMLFNRLETTYGISGSSLEWIKSYLCNRTQKITIRGKQSRPFSLQWGVPQGSVLGPLLFTLYTGPLCEVISSHHGIHHAIYADDTQLMLVKEQLLSASSRTAYVTSSPGHLPTT